MSRQSVVHGYLLVWRDNRKPYSHVFHKDKTSALVEKSKVDPFSDKISVIHVWLNYDVGDEEEFKS